MRESKKIVIQIFQVDKSLLVLKINIWIFSFNLRMNTAYLSQIENTQHPYKSNHAALKSVFFVYLHHSLKTIFYFCISPKTCVSKQVSFCTLQIWIRQESIFLPASAKTTGPMKRILRDYPKIVSRSLKSGFYQWTWTKQL